MSFLKQNGGRGWNCKTTDVLDWIKGLVFVLMTDSIQLRFKYTTGTMRCKKNKEEEVENSPRSKILFWFLSTNCSAYSQNLGNCSLNSVVMWDLRAQKLHFCAKFKN